MSLPGAAIQSDWSADHIRSKFSGKSSTRTSDLQKVHQVLSSAAEKLTIQEDGIRYISEIVEINQITDWSGEQSLNNLLLGARSTRSRAM